MPARRVALSLFLVSYPLLGGCLDPSEEPPAPEYVEGQILDQWWMLNHIQCDHPFYLAPLVEWTAPSNGNALNDGSQAFRTNDNASAIVTDVIGAENLSNAKVRLVVEDDAGEPVYRYDNVLGPDIKFGVIENRGARDFRCNWEIIGDAEGFSFAVIEWACDEPRY